MLIISTFTRPLKPSAIPGRLISVVVFTKKEAILIKNSSTSVRIRPGIILWNGFSSRHTGITEEMDTTSAAMARIQFLSRPSQQEDPAQIHHHQNQRENGKAEFFQFVPILSFYLYQNITGMFLNCFCFRYPERKSFFPVLYWCT